MARKYRIRNPRCYVLRYIGSNSALYLGGPKEGSKHLLIAPREGAKEYQTAAEARAARDADFTSPAHLWRVFRRGRVSR